MQHIPRKRFGQNFLQDQYIINKIVECINPQPQQTLIEIGPGLAALTKPLIDKIGHLNVVEIDRDLIELLKQNFSPEQLTIHAIDALKFDFSTFTQLRIVGNLPYNISTPFLFHLQQFNNIQDMTFMLQKEVVERICATPNNGSYGRLTIMLQYKYHCRQLLEVPAHAFYPAPQVESAVIALTPRSDYDWSQVNVAKLNLVVTKAFSQRRKTISNSLKSILISDQLQQLGLSPTLRAENLSVTDYIRLSQLL